MRYEGYTEKECVIYDRSEELLLSIFQKNSFYNIFSFYNCFLFYNIEIAGNIYKRKCNGNVDWLSIKIYVFHLNGHVNKKVLLVIGKGDIFYFIFYQLCKPQSIRVSSVVGQNSLCATLFI